MLKFIAMIITNAQYSVNRRTPGGACVLAAAVGSRISRQRSRISLIANLNFKQQGGF
jgi:hypothetical protein